MTLSALSACAGSVRAAQWRFDDDPDFGLKSMKESTSLRTYIAVRLGAFQTKLRLFCKWSQADRVPSTSPFRSIGGRAKPLRMSSISDPVGQMLLDPVVLPRGRQACMTTSELPEPCAGIT